MERRLAAILAVDVVEYTRLMNANEAGTLARLRSLRIEVVQPKIGEHKGRIAKLMGDGLLAEFPSAVKAVQCAIELQEAISTREADVSDEERIRLRIGVNLGDVIVEDADVYGTGVNVAVRLEALAEPGGVCISGQVFDMIDSSLGARFNDAGERQLKNIAKPVRIFTLAVDGSGDDKTQADALTPHSASNSPSIAVLPFDNLSGDREQEYFSDGITEDIITELSRFRELSVVSRSSSFSFKNTSISLRDIGLKLGVQYVVEGSLRKAGNRVRVTVQLLDADADKHIWAERYERDLEDIFELQDDVVRRISGTLVGRLEHERHEKVKKRSPNQLRAYDLYLRGRELFFNWSSEDNLAARDLLQAATDTQPDYAAALALLSEAVLRMFLNGWSEDPEKDLREAFNLARRAVEIDDEDSRVHTALGMAYIFQRDLDRAKYHFDIALKLNPNDTRVLAYYSRQAVLDGETTKAIQLCLQATARNPYGKYGWNLGIAYFAAREYERAIEQLSSIRNPPLAPLSISAACHAMIGDETKTAVARELFFDSARTCATTSGFTRPDEWREFFAVRWPFRESERLDHLLEALSRAGIPVRD